MKIEDKRNCDAKRHAIILCMLLFLFQPFQLGLWLSRVAEMQATIGLTKSQLALALLGMPAGLLPSLYFAGRIVEKWGARRSIAIMVLPMLCVGILPGFATSQKSLFFALFFNGIFVAIVEVGMNLYAAQTEKKYKSVIMNRAHGFWSLGMMLGSLIGVLLAKLEINTTESLAIIAMIILPVLLIVVYLMPTNPKQIIETSESESQGIPPMLWLIILTVFGVTLVEGAMIDWATVYMRDLAHIVAGREGLAVTVFAGMVTLGRFSGDWFNARLGAKIVARLCILSAVMGISILIANLGVTASFIGFGLVGLGVSTIFPLGVSACASLDQSHEARNVSVMTFGALSGFLLGPPLIGFVADAYSLSFAFALLMPGLLMSAALAYSLAAKKA